MFRNWASANLLPIGAETALSEIDASLEKFVESTFLANEGVFSARSAVYGEAWLRGANIKDVSVLWRARQALEGWTNLCPEHSKEPLPWITCCLIADQMLDMQSSKPIMADAAECFIIQFDTYVRPDVACSLCDHNVILPSAGASKKYQRVGLLLAPSSDGMQTKTGSQDDSVLVGAGPRQFVSQLLTNAVRRCRKRGGGALWPGLNLPAYERCVKEAAAAAGLASQKVTPHLARHGGISTDVFEGTFTLEQASKRGHWRCAASTRRYEKHARLLNMLQKLSLQQRVKANAVALTLGKRLLSRQK